MAILRIIQNAANYVSETVQGAGAQASKETNKQVAKDSDASLGTRASAAKDAIFDKKDEKVHDAKSDVHKGKSHFQLTYLYMLTIQQSRLSTKSG